jgi:hypothetical protein
LSIRGFAGLDEALAIAPSHNALRWDIARAYALKRAGPDHDRVIAELEARSFSRERSGPLRMRFAMARGSGDRRNDRSRARRVFDPFLHEGLFAVYLDGGWRLA